MLTTVLLVFAAAALAPPLYRRWPRIVAWAPAALTSALFFGYLAQVPEVVGGARLAETIAWSRSFAVSAAFLLDGLSLTFALLITGIGALVLAYAVPYLGRGPRLGPFLGYLLLFLGSMLGLVLADDVIVMFVFWELTSISSFFLIAFEDSAASRKKAQQALVVTAGGGLALMVGFLLLRLAGGELGLEGALAGRMSALATVDLPGHELYLPIVLLVALGAFTKSAQVPFHFWLPGAMVAPTPVSAFLHSATMVKAGVYLLARLHPTLGETPLWIGLLVPVGAATLLTGALLAPFQRDLKLILAYSTVAVLGLLTMLCGLGTTAAFQAFAVYLLAHALYKAALFLVAGIVDHQAGTRDPFVPRRLLGELPLSATAALVAAAGMAGIPPFLGFIAKESTLVAALGGPAAVAVTAAAVAGSALLVCAALLVSATPFLGGAEPAQRRREAPAAMVTGPLLLAALGLLFGLLPGLLAEPLLGSIASAMAGRREEVDLSLWHGVAGPYGVALLLSAVSLTAGAIGYLHLSRRPPSGKGLAPRLHSGTATALYERGMDALWRGADVVATFMQSGLLRRYVLVTLGFTFAVLCVPLALELSIGVDPIPLEFRWHEVMIAVLAGAGAVLTAGVHERITAIAALGTTGIAIALLFALFGAPDLAITQIMVETLMVILLVLVFRHLPPAAVRHGVTRRTAHIALAAVGGVTVALFVLAAAPTRYPNLASRYFVAESAEQEAGNVVNTILVNFRALDTLGEIVVLAIAGLGVFALLRLGPAVRSRTGPPPGRGRP